MRPRPRASAASRGERPRQGRPPATPRSRPPPTPTAPGPALAPTAHADRSRAPTAVVSPPASEAATVHAPGEASGTALRPDPAIARPAGGTEGAAPTARKPPPARRPARGRALALLAAAVAVALAVLALSGAFTGSSGGGDPLSAREVRGVVGGFARAYGREDVRALGRTLSPGVRRIAPGSSQEGRAAVLAEYRRQFAANAVRGYRVTGLSVRAGAVGRAEGLYTVPRAGGGPIAGRIVFGVARIGGKPRIALIAAEPRA